MIYSLILLSGLAGHAFAMPFGSDAGFSDVFPYERIEADI